MSWRVALCMGLVGVMIVASESPAADSLLIFETAPAGSFVRSATYTENGMLVTSFSDNASFGDPLNSGGSGQWLYFHGNQQYVEFSRVDGAPFDLVSFDAATNGFSNARWVTSSSGAKQAFPGAARQTVVLGPGFQNITWFRIGTPSFATQVDNIRIRIIGFHDVVPNHADYDGLRTVQVHLGSGFTGSTSIKLRRAGLPDVVGRDTGIDANGTVATTTLDLSRVPPGPWDVVVETGGDVLVFPFAFTVEGPTDLGFDAVPAGPLPRGGTYVENGMQVTSFSNNSSFGDPMGAGYVGNWLYFDGGDQYIELRLLDGAPFDLVSFEAVTNGYSDARWVTSSSGGTQTFPGLSRQTVVLGPGFQNVTWVRIGTPSYATQVDNVRFAAGAIPWRCNGGEDVTLSASAVWPSGSFACGHLRVLSGAKLTVGGMTSIAAAAITVEAGASISADGNGYAALQGPGAGLPNTNGYGGGSGGGHGGRGGQSTVAGGARYDSAMLPTQMGSGGSGAPGGGYISFTAAGRFQLDGSISANGADATQYWSAQLGGGAGGGVLITTQTFAGDGTITANGGKSSPNWGGNAGGGGGGGRVFVRSQASTFHGVLRADGGVGVRENGEPGTAGLLDMTTNDLSSTTSWRFQTNDGPLTLGTITFDGATVGSESGVSLTATALTARASTIAVTGAESFTIDDVGLDGSVVAGDLTLNARGVTLTSSSALRGNVDIHATTLSIDATSSVSADGTGYPAGQGPGAGLTGPYAPASGSGGGYGGRGGNGGNQPGGPTYGSAIAPTDSGSGGGGAGGSGGGHVRLVLGDRLQNDGTISANGSEANQYWSYQGGGGAGGSIFILTETLAGSGTIAANGGRSGPNWGGAAGGGGGGGRIAIFNDEHATFSGTLAVRGGVGVGANGAEGTVTQQRRMAIQPNRGGDTGSVSVVISGATFSANAAAWLQRDGETIQGTSTIVGEDGALRTIFDLTAHRRGDWDVVVDDGGRVMTLQSGFTVEEGTIPHLWVDLLGSPFFRSGSEAMSWVLYGNAGNTDQWAAHVFVRFSAEMDVMLPEDTSFVHVSPGSVAQILVAHLPARGAAAVALKTRATSDFALDLAISSGSEGIRPVPFEPYPLATVADARSPGRRAGLRAMDVEAPPLMKGGQQPPSGYVHMFVVSDPNVGVKIFDEAAIQVGDDVMWSYPDSKCTNGKGLERIPYSAFHFDAQGNGHVTIDGHEVLVKKEFSVRPAVPGKTFPEIQALMQQNLPKFAEYKFKDPGEPDHQAISCIGFVIELIFGPPKDPGAIPPPFLKCGSTGCGFTMSEVFADWFERLGIDGVAELGLQSNTPAGFDAWMGNEKKTFPRQAFVSHDPNDKLGSVGGGAPWFYTAGDQPLRYMIHFENEASATAPAREVVVTDDLDADLVDLATVNLGPMTCGGKVAALSPLGTEPSETVVDLRPDVEALVRVTATLDRSSGRLQWRFLALDPVTGLPPADPLAGFLPPNGNPPAGEGGVVFTVLPRSDLPTGTRVTNQASIVFDTNDPILTPVWLNTINQPRCAPTPDVACRHSVAGASSLNLRDQAAAGKDTFAWTWNRGDATALLDFRDPVRGFNDYRICIYDSSSRSQPLMEAQVYSGGSCGSSTCWKEAGTTGFKFKSKLGDPDGIMMLTLKAGGAGKAKLKTKGKGSNLHLPSLPLTGPVTVQFVVNDGGSRACWEDVFTAPSRNDMGAFEAKGP